MINLCPNEADPSDGIDAFLKDPEILVLPGLRNQILQMAECVEQGLRAAEPDSEIIVLNRDTLVDLGISFPSELRSFLQGKLSEGRKVNVIVMEDIPVIGWQSAMEVLRGADAEVYGVSMSCKFVPICVKLLRIKRSHRVCRRGTRRSRESRPSRNLSGRTRRSACRPCRSSS